ncbi:MAG: hypothetical protein AAFV53_15865 [Myxococcota bacterium]
MSSPVRRRTVLPPEIEAEAVALLRSNASSDRLRAAQLLARGWAIDEEARVAALPELIPEEE